MCFEDFNSAYMGLLKYHSSIMRNNENVEFFYCIEDSGLDQLKRPFFMAFQGKNKFLEMRLNLSEEDFEEMVQRVQRIEEQSIEESSIRSEQAEEFSGNIEDFDEKRGVFLEFLIAMRDSREINELQYYYMKCLYLENNNRLLHSLYTCLEY